ncbi:unnamed protein product [Symbiodinium sp. KB8]|nr:unnamed protein product [Symbiodinium sp. KB8]
MVGTWMLRGSGRSLSGRYHGWHMDALWERTEFVWMLSWLAHGCFVGTDGLCRDVIMVAMALWERPEFVWTLSWLPHGCFVETDGVCVDVVHGWNMDVLREGTEFLWALPWLAHGCSAGTAGVGLDVIMVGTWTELLWTVSWLAHGCFVGTDGLCLDVYHGWHMDALWERTDFVWTLSWLADGCFVGTDGVCLDVIMVFLGDHSLEQGRCLQKKYNHLLGEELLAYRGNMLLCHNMALPYSELLHRCRTEVRTTWPRLHLRAQDAGNVLSSLYPTHARFWWPVLEDITYSPAVQDKLRGMLATLEQADEWLYISVDATLKTCLKLKGQESYRASKRVRNEAPFPDASAWRRLLTVRGRTGAVLLLEPIRTEKSEDIVGSFERNFSNIALSQIRYMATDQPSPKLHDWLKTKATNLICLCLDPIHLAIVYEYAQWNKNTVGSKMLRALLSKILNFWLSMAMTPAGTGARISTVQMPDRLTEQRKLLCGASLGEEEAEFDVASRGLVSYVCSIVEAFWTGKSSITEKQSVKVGLGRGMTVVLTQSDLALCLSGRNPSLFMGLIQVAQRHGSALWTDFLTILYCNNFVEQPWTSI